MKIKMVILLVLTVLFFCSCALTDSRDKKYKTVTIGDQVWMAENMNYQIEEGSWCFSNKSSDCAKYGRLYNWETALKACPSGWHLPGDDEWTQLVNYLSANGYNYDGSTSGNKAAKSLASTSGWPRSDNEGAVGNNQSTNNTTGFSGFPSGFRDSNGTFYNFGKDGYWWSSTEASADSAWYRYLNFSSGEVYRFSNNKDLGLSVRCLRD